MKPMNSRKVRISRIVRPAWWLLSWFFKRADDASTPATILIFDFHLIGDIVWLTPLLRALRQGYSGAHITLVAGPWAQDILKGTSWVDEIVPFSAPWVKYGQGWRGLWRCLLLVRKLRRRRWDLGIEIRGDIRQILLLTLSGARRRVGYNLTGGGPLLTDVVPLPASVGNHIAADYHRNLCEYLGVWHGEEYLPELKLSGAEIEEVRELTEFVGINFGASLPLRRPPTALMIAFVDQLVKCYNGPLVLYRIREDPEVTDLLAARLRDEHGIPVEIWDGSLRNLIVHLSKCKKLYCVDSGPAHIAAALGVEVTVIYGPTLPHLTRPLGRRVHIVDGPELPCRPCDQRNCTSRIHQECFPPASKWL